MANQTSETLSLDDAEEQFVESRLQAEQEGVALFRAHLHVFIPSIVMVIAYLLAWYLTSISEISTLPAIRVFIILFAVIVPMMIAWAFLRFETIRLQVHDDHLIYHSGWPKGLPLEIHFSDISKISMKRGFLGQQFGGGDLLIHDLNDRIIAIRSLKNMTGAIEAISKARKKHAAGQ